MSSRFVPLVAAGLAVTTVCTIVLAGAVNARSSAQQATSSLRLEDVSAESAADVWGVGATQGENQEPAIVHWDGTALSQVPTNLGSGAPGEIVPGGLHGVSADAPADAWAVGNVSPPRAHMIQSLVLRWDGSRWSQVASPNPSPVANDLLAVKANTPEDIWAEGEYLDPGTHKHRLFVIHWDGSRWSTVQLPKAVARQVQLFGFRSFDPVGARSAFAVGTHVAPNGIKSDRVLHWNGRSWSKAPFFYGAALFALSASSASDVWAVGYNCVLRRCPPFHTAAYHSNGGRWKGGVFYKRGDPFTGHEVIPSPSEGSSKLVSVTDHTPNDVWATGTCSGRCPHGHRFVLHWDGGAWARTPYPVVAPTSAISSISGSDAWVVGGGSLLHWDGSSWSTK